MSIPPPSGVAFPHWAALGGFEDGMTPTDMLIIACIASVIGVLWHASAVAAVNRRTRRIRFRYVKAKPMPWNDEDEEHRTTVDW